MTYRQLSETSNRYARWALGEGLAAGDVVCLLMPNCPQYFAIWLGITRVGAFASLINSNLSGDMLAHAVEIVAPKNRVCDRRRLVSQWRSDAQGRPRLLLFRRPGRRYL